MWKVKVTHTWDGGQGQRKCPGGSEGQECQLHILLVSKQQQGQARELKRLNQQAPPAGPFGLQSPGALGQSVGFKLIRISSLPILFTLPLRGTRAHKARLGELREEGVMW